MKHKVKAVILPTEDSSVICGTTTLEYRGAEPQIDSLQNQHAYVTVSHEPIKEGDWYMSHGNKKVIKCSTRNFENPKVLKLENEIHNTGHAKIIATDDPKLYSLDILKIGDTVISDKVGYNKQTLTNRKQVESYNLSDHYFKQLPQVQQSFLKEYVANPDGEFEVEYLPYCKTGKHATIKEDCNCPCTDELHCGYTLKLNQDNTVNITSVEEKMYSLAQVVEAYNEGYSEASGQCCGPMDDKDSVFAENWIKKHL